MRKPIVDDRDWSALSIGEILYNIEVEGYAVIPDLLSLEHIANLKERTSKLETRAVDYSINQQTRSHLEFEGGVITDLIAHPPTLNMLAELFGDCVIFTSFSYARSEPGHPGISLHTDGQPYGSQIFGYEGSCPVLIRVLYYLDDLTSEVSPFRVVPRSHISIHAESNPYLRYSSHPEEVMVLAKAGSAVFLNHKVFHGNFPNVGDHPREMLAVGYRPAYAGPISYVDPWDPDDLEQLPENIRPLFGDPNTRKWSFHGGNKPTDMKSEAHGIAPSRWKRSDCTIGEFVRHSS